MDSHIPLERDACALPVLPSRPVTILEWINQGTNRGSGGLAARRGTFTSGDIAPTSKTAPDGTACGPAIRRVSLVPGSVNPTSTPQRGEWMCIGKAECKPEASRMQHLCCSLAGRFGGQPREEWRCAGPARESGSVFSRKRG